MQVKRLMVSLAVASACAAGASVSLAQTSTDTTTASPPASTTSTAGTATTTGAGPTGAASTTAPATSTTSTTAPATSTTSTPTAGASETQFLRHAPHRFVTLAGSRTNLENLVHGLRTGTAITLTSTQTASSGTAVTQNVTFTPPTRPMGYGNITRTFTLASRQLAAAGITNPTPQQLQAALTGGTITTAKGTTTLQGVLQLRSQGMGWGQIAHTIGVHAGSDKSASTLAEHASRTSGIATAAGSARSSSMRHDSTPETHRGIVTASGSGTTTVQREHSAEVRVGSGVVTAAGTTGAGIVSASGHGSGQVRGHDGKH